MPAVLRHDEDPTGTSVDNRVTNEPVTLTGGAVRVFVPTYGAFFGESMVVIDTATGLPLRGDQYYNSMLAAMPTHKFGRGIFYCVVVKDSSVSANLSITYQALGGELAYSNSALAALLRSVLEDNRPVDWNTILGRPSGFVPGEHLHDIGDVYGFEYIVEALYSIREAITMDNTSAMIKIYDNTMTAVNNALQSVQNVRTEIYQSISGLVQQINALQVIANRVTALENNAGTRFVTPAMMSAAFADHIAQYHSNPAYALLPNTTSINEDGTVIFTVTADNVPDGTTMYWTTTTTDNINAADFSDGQMTGSVVINGETGTISRTMVLGTDVINGADAHVAEHFSLQLHTGSLGGQIVATSQPITVNDTSPIIQPTYSIVPNVSNVNEGGTVTFNVTTTNITNGTVLAYRIDGANITGNDFVDGSIEGTYTINNNSGFFTKQLRADGLTEGAEIFNASVIGFVGSGATFTTSTNVTIDDTSANATPVYSIAPSATSVDEGSTVVFTVNTTNVADGTTLYYVTNSVNGVNSDDFDNPQISGSIVINGGTASLSRTIKADTTTEGSEAFQIWLRTGSISGPTVAQSATVTINDTSVSAAIPTYSMIFTGSSQNIDETTNNVATFDITTTNVSNGTVLYWSTEGSSGIASADFTDGVLTGSVTINGNTGSVTRTLTADATSEGTEEFYLQLRTGSTSGPIVVTSTAVVFVADTSTTPVNVVAGNSGPLTSNSIFTLPANSGNTATIYYIGGGGGGGGGTSRSFAPDFFAPGSGGGGASMFSRTIAVTPGFSFQVVIGAGGAAGQARDGRYTSGTDGGKGDTTSVFYEGSIVGSAPGAYGGTVAQGLNPGITGDSGFGTGGATDIADAIGSVFRNGFAGTASYGTITETTTEGNEGGPVTSRYMTSTQRGNSGPGFDELGASGSPGIGGATETLEPLTGPTAGTGAGAGGGGGGGNNGNNSAQMQGVAGVGGLAYIVWG